jgi:predicted nucleotide-binding protein
MENIEQNRKVFVVHGRDGVLRKAMFDFLRSINLHPMEWHELTADSGTGTPYIGAVLDRAFQQAQAVVVMLTPDEDVQLSPRLGGGEAGSQARPNVLFEAGLALARNPTRTIIVEIGSMRPFSDIAGRHVVRLDDSLPNAVAKRQDLAQRLQVAGCNVSLRRTDWHSAGLFRAI